MRQPSASQHNFAKVPAVSIPRSVFARSNGYKTTFDCDYLIPFYIDEVLPGDTHTVQSTIQARLNTPYFPIMDNVYLTTFFFFVPNRLVWENWEKMNGERNNPNDSIDYLTPSFAVPNADRAAGFLANYFGLKPNSAGLPGHITVNSLPFRMYNLIWNDWFRDQNLQDSVPVPVTDGGDNISNYTLLRRGKQHDYFTSCLPWPQKGNAVSLPLGSSADVWGSITDTTPIADWPLYSPVTGAYLDRVTDGTALSRMQSAVITSSGVGDNVAVTNDILAISGSSTVSNSPQNYGFGNKALSQGAAPNARAPWTADLSTATAVTINALRQAFALQGLLERDARGGTRYVEVLRSHFGVISPDFRLQRPEYLGGGQTPLIISTVAQTSASENGSPQANLAAFGVFSAHGSRNGFTKSFVEHGFIIGLLQVRADLNYQQGNERFWYRTDRFSYYWPALAHLGEQAVLRREIYVSGSPSDTNVFGYQEAWAEYRYKPSQITGAFNSLDPNSLDAWHLAQEFSLAPVLNSSFIQSDTPMDRVVVVPSEPQFKADIYNHVISARPMPVYSVPGLTDTF